MLQLFVVEFGIIYQHFKCTHPLNQQFYLDEFMLQQIGKSTYSQRSLCKGVHCNIIYNKEKAEKQPN